MSVSVSKLKRGPLLRVPNDFYCEPPWLVRALLDTEPFVGIILDPCCGCGTIPSCCRQRYLEVIGADLVDRGYHGTVIQDFFDRTEPVDAIIANPPYGLAQAFIDHGLSLAPKVAMLLRMAFLESQRRRPWFAKSPLARVWISSRRPSIPPGVSIGQHDLWGAVVQPTASGGSMPYCWMISVRGHNGRPEIGWL